MRAIRFYWGFAVFLIPSLPHIVELDNTLFRCIPKKWNIR